MKDKALIIIVIVLAVLIVIVFAVNKKTEQARLAAQHNASSEEASLMAALLNYRTEIDSRREDQKFRWQDLFMGQAAVSEGVGNIFLGMGSMGGG